MGREGRATAVEKFSVEAHVDRFVATYRAVLASRAV
jgi:hypothetical protein